MPSDGTINSSLATLIFLILTQSQHCRCINAQRELITALINEHSGNREVGYTLAAQPNRVIYKDLSALLIEEGAIYEVIVDQCNKHDY
jgi:hypothetical protein